MDKELIAKVHARPLIWYGKQDFRGNSRKALWDEIATELGVATEDARTRWRTLRDTFTRRYRTGTHWEHHQSMVFLLHEKPDLKSIYKRRRKANRKPSSNLDLIPSVQNDACVEDGERSAPVSSGEDCNDDAVEPKIKIDFIRTATVPGAAHVEIKITQGGDQSVEKSRESEP
ncbi:uncharacterized protein LOC129718942 [Wyeomyia smithii]|uniref:uncharacterized protein LOC129718942 n=1 Tax=Wyeomyia smithii TaxID=174621 RepID=UPI0024681BAF|nr:uncharacterized protein LOC129718942 [Wyeomyia smithii]